MVLKRTVQDYYRDNPLMVSSPFGGVEGVNSGLLKQVLASLDIGLNGRNILDAGCGRGYAGEVVRELGGVYTGVDFVRSRDGFPHALADAAYLPFPDAAFDVVFCIDAFEHFPDPDKAAREFRRVLRPSGCVFLSAPNYGNVAGLVKKWCETYGSYEKNTWAPFRQWQPQEWETFLTRRRVERIYSNAGLRAGRIIGHGSEVGLGLFPWLAHPRMPERIYYRCQAFFAALGPAMVRHWPGASLHVFWRFDV